MKKSHASRSSSTRRSVTVPVTRVGDRWEFVKGGDLLIRDGAYAELILDADQILDEGLRRRLTLDDRIKVLDEGTELRVALSDREFTGHGAGFSQDLSPANLYIPMPPGTTRFVSVWLSSSTPVSRNPQFVPAADSGALWLRLRGLDECELQAGAVRMPEGFETPTARSLNHAFTLLSKAYEKHRISNTGNVYTRIYYQETNGNWYPLDDLRQDSSRDGSRGVLRRVWNEADRILQG